MKRLGRWLIRISLLVALLAVLMALAVGLALERFHPDGIAELERRTPWSITVERYQRGWFSTEATLTATDSYGALAWRHSLRIAHGPWVNDPGTLAWLGARGSLEPAGSAPAATIRWWVTPGLNVEGRIDFSAAGPLDGRIELTLGERFSRLDFRLIDLALPLPDGASVERLDGGGWATFGRQPAGAEMTLTARRMAAPALVIDGPDLDLALDQAGDSIGLRLALSATHVGLDQSYRDATLDLEVERLHQPSLALLLDSVARAAPAGAAALGRQLGQALLPALPGLLNHRPGIALKRLRLDAPQGPVEASASVALIEPPAAGYLADPALLLPALEASWEAALPAALAQRWLEVRLAAHGYPPEALAEIADEVIANWQADGLVVVTDERLLARGQLIEGLLNVDGRRLPAGLLPDRSD